MADERDAVDRLKLAHLADGLDQVQQSLLRVEWATRVVRQALHTCVQAAPHDRDVLALREHVANIAGDILGANCSLSSTQKALRALAADGAPATEPACAEPTPPTEPVAH